MKISPAPPPTTSALRWFSLLAMVAGVVAGLIAAANPPGINVVIVGALMGAAVLVVARDRMAPIDWAFGIAGFVFIAIFAVRTSEWVLLADLCAAGGLASLAMSHGASWAAVIKGGFRVLGRLHRSLAPILAPVRDTWRGFDRVASGPWLRGSAVGLLLAVVFGALFASADQAFARIASEFFIPNWDVGLFPARFITAFVVICFTGAYASVATAPTSGIRVWTFPAGATHEPRRLQAADWAIPIALLDVVFALFVVVQVTVLFGGEQHVLETAGLTYAEYARSGFFQLVAIAALVLGVIALTVRFADQRSPRDRRLMRYLLGVLCVLTLVVLASALRRLGLYEDTYGFTRLRLFVHVSILWLSVVLIAVMAAGARWGSGWLPRAVVWISVVMLLGVNLVNPDAFIATKNIERYVATGQIDTDYLSTLSSDAVPALAAAPLEIRACLLSSLAGRLAEPLPFWSLNLSRNRAREALASTSLGDCSSRVSNNL